MRIHKTLAIICLSLLIVGHAGLAVADQTSADFDGGVEPYEAATADDQGVIDAAMDQGSTEDPDIHKDEAAQETEGTSAADAVLAVDGAEPMQDDEQVSGVSSNDEAGPDGFPEIIATYDVSDFGAVGDGETDDTLAINKALRMAQNASGGVQVNMPVGTYKVSSYLFIYSNTKLVLDDDATVIATEDFSSGTMIGAVHEHDGQFCDGVRSSCTAGGYTQVHDIWIEGGTWDRNITGATPAAVMRFNHGTNFTLRNTTLLHSSDHFINISGSKNVTIDNVTFKDFSFAYVKKNTYYWNEAVHADSMEAIGEKSAYPQDGTIARDITVKNCTFSNVLDGVGNHHLDAKHAKNIMVTGCTFEKLSGHAANIIGLDDYVIENCTAIDCTMFAYVTKDTGTIIRNNRILGTKRYSTTMTTMHDLDAIKVIDSFGVTITGNTIINASCEGILVVRQNSSDPTNSCTLTVNNNTVYSTSGVAGEYDITIGRNCTGTSRNNNVGIRGFIHWKAKDDFAVVTESNNGTKDTADKVMRLYGTGRYDTMKAIVQKGFTEAGGTAIVATGSNFKDALSAAGLAGLDGAPVILTSGKSLSSQAKSELLRLKPTAIFIAGGEAAVSKTVADQIKSATGVKPTRIAGKTSPSTSAELARAGIDRWEGGTAVIATNKSFKDALSVAPVAYAMHWPILLASDGLRLSPDVLEALSECEVERVYIVGGTKAVDPYVEEQLEGANIEVAGRWAGANGPATSAAIAKKGIELGMTINNMGVATSQNFPDALAGAAFCGKTQSVLVLADDKAMSNASFPKAYSSSIRRVYVFGGASAVGTKCWTTLVCSAAY